MSVTTEIAAPLAFVRVNNPPVNALSHAVREGLMKAVARLDSEESVKAVILICEGRTFIAGADIREFGQTPKEPHLPDVIHAIEQAGKPWIAAIHGTALGGGCEVALGCHYRIAVPSAKLGLPEVNLGLLPGAGGTVRLPRLVGITVALEMITTGKPVSAEQAAACKLVDRIAPEGNLETFSGFFAKSIIDAPMPAIVSERQVADVPSAREWQEIITSVEMKSRGQLSPVEAARAIRDAATLGVAEAFKSERARFTGLRDSDQSRALRHVFFAERQTAKIPQLEGVTPNGISHCGVVGGGTMGAGIAASMLLADLPVTMIERDKTSADAGRKRVEKILANSQQRGLVSSQQLARIKSSFHTSASHDDLSTSDLVVEAVFEDMDVKKQVFAELEKACSAKTILASNTSYLDINEIANSVQNPGRVLGLHFFSPAHIMKLLEVIKSDSVSPETLATGFALAKKLRKVPVLAGVCDGFIGNRILAAYRKQCDYMLEDGASPREIDEAMREFGMAMGPFEMQDLAGLDIGWANRKRLAATRDPNERYVKIADRLCELGRFGQKTGSGWYLYTAGNRKGIVDPEVEQIIAEERRAARIRPQKFTAEEIRKRILDAMISEGADIRKEGIARSYADIDMVMILGYGFPRWRGGPMFAGGMTD